MGGSWCCDWLVQLIVYLIGSFYILRQFGELYLMSSAVWWLGSCMGGSLLVPMIMFCINNKGAAYVEMLFNLDFF